MGPTLEVLSYFSCTRVARLLSVISKKGGEFLKKKEQDIFQTCMPSIFDAKMEELPDIVHLNQSIPVQKVMHLRDSLFIVSYINGLIEMVDFATPEAEEPLLSFQVPNDDEAPDVEFLRIITDFDVACKSEERILLCFQECAVAFLNLPAKQFNLIKHAARM